MPTTVYFPKESVHSGIDITWTKTRQSLSIGGWYDTFVGIANTEISLREFFDSLGITEKECIKAFKAVKNDPNIQK
jgi:hypothetical protein